MKLPTLKDIKSINLKYVARRALSSLTEQWYARGDGPSQDRRRLLICTYNSNIFSNLIGGTFFTGMLLLMGADDSIVGMTTMIAVLANLLQLVTPLILERFPSRKKLIMILRSILLFINIVFIGVIPLFPMAQQGRLVMTLIAILIVNVINAVIAPGISIWHIQSIPPNVRTGFYSLITMTNGAIVALFNWLGSIVVDLFKAQGNEYWGLFSLRMVALALAVFDMFLYGKIKEYPYEDTGGKKLRIRDVFLMPFREKLYLKTAAVSFLWNFSANIPGSYFTVYMMKTINVEYTYLNIISMLSVPITLFLTPVWKRVLSRHGWFKTLYKALAVYLFYLVGLAFVTPGTIWLYPLSMVWAYITGIGITLSFTAIPYVNMPKKNQTAFMGFYSTVGNLAAFLGVALGRSFVLSNENTSVYFLGITMGDKQLLMLLTASMMALAALGVYFIQRSMPRPE